jgi:hypothetical protein
VLRHHPGLGQFEQCAHLGHKLHGFVDRKELNGVVQKEEIGLIVRAPFHLADRLLLVFPIHRAQHLLIEEPPQFRRLDDPSGTAIEREPVVQEKRPGEIAMIMIRRQGDIPGLLRWRLIQIA